MNRFKDILKQFPFVYPSGIIRSCKAWIDQKNANAGVYKGLRGHRYLLIVGPESHTFDLPRLQDTRDADRFDSNIFYGTSPAYLYYLKDCYLYKKIGLVLSSRNALFQEFSHHFGISSLADLLVKNPFYTYSTKIRRISGIGAVLVSPESHNYYHWLSDVLPRIKLYERVIGHIDHFCVSGSVPEKFLITLQAFGIPMHKILLVNDVEKLHFDTLYVASLPGSEGRSPQWAINYVRQRMLPRNDLSIKTDQKVYLKRGSSDQRKLLNEDAITALLIQRGFRIIVPEEHSVAEQVAIMQQASIVIGAHGAALSNLLFVPEGASVIEFFSTDYFRTDCYFTLSRMLKLDYHYIKGFKPDGADWGDIEIDESLLLGTLGMIDEHLGA